MNPSLRVLLLSSLLVSLLGCKQDSPPSFRLNQVQVLSAERVNLADDEKIPQKTLEQIGTMLTALFGTPGDPRFPFLQGAEDPAHEILSLERLRRAAGAPPNGTEKAAGLFELHCARCHGISGDGAGKEAATLEPYPRDYRLGKFKFKSTPLGKRPTDSDLTRILKQGIPGSAMPSFRDLPEDEISDLVDYVKYLSIRGEVERQLIFAASKLENDEQLFDLSESDSKKQSDYEEQLRELIDDVYLERVLPKWLDRERFVSTVPPAPPNFAASHPSHQELLERGKQLFHGSAGCVLCHGATGIGDGQTENFDDWTQWAKDTRAIPGAPSTYGDYISAGALPPRYIRPRDLNLQVYRGGDRPEDLYLRVLNGIEGTPMPSAVSLQSQPSDIWALVAYVQSFSAD